MIKSIDREVVEKMVGVLGGTIKMTDKEKDFFVYELNLALLNNCVDIDSKETEAMRDQIADLEEENEKLQDRVDELEDQLDELED